MVDRESASGHGRSRDGATPIRVSGRNWNNLTVDVSLFVMRYQFISVRSSGIGIGEEEQ